MNPLKLARVAAEAEMLRLRAILGRVVTRIAFGVVALLFLLAVLVVAHILAWHALTVSAQLGFYPATSIVGGADLVLALIFLALASRSSPSAAEREAYEVRQRALLGMRRVGNLSQLAMPTLQMANAIRKRRRRNA